MKRGKFTREQAIRIISAHESGMTVKQLSGVYRCVEATIRTVLARRGPYSDIPTGVRLESALRADLRALAMAMLDNAAHGGSTMLVRLDGRAERLFRPKIQPRWEQRNLIDDATGRVFRYFAEVE